MDVGLARTLGVGALPLRPRVSRWQILDVVAGTRSRRWQLSAGVGAGLRVILRIRPPPWSFGRVRVSRLATNRSGRLLLSLVRTERLALQRGQYYRRHGHHVHQSRSRGYFPAAQ